MYSDNDIYTDATNGGQQTDPTLGISLTPVTVSESETEADEVTGEAATLTTSGTKSFRFSSMHHSGVQRFLATVNTDGLSALFTRALQNIEPEPPEAETGAATEFEDSYVPTTAVLQPYPDNASVEFEPTAPNGSYNYELFFHAPLLIANRLQQARKFEDAQRWYHAIFEPGNTEMTVDAPQRYWIPKPFFEAGQGNSANQMMAILSYSGKDEELLAQQAEYENQLDAWAADPFNPHRIAQLRPTAYMKNVVMKYLDNLIAWGDSLFAQDTMESVNEATLLYVLAARLLGERPLAAQPEAQESLSYEQLSSRYASYSAPGVELENYLPEATFNVLRRRSRVLRRHDAAMVTTSDPYFCTPENATLMAYWDTVADRLFKVRNCRNLEGQVRQLPLFQPPIDPALLVKARAANVDIAAALDLAGPASVNYKFGVLVRKALEFTSEVKSLGAQLLSALEKQDAEALSLLRTGHEKSLLQANTDIRTLQLKEAKATLKSLEKSLATAQRKRLEYSTRQSVNEEEEQQETYLKRSNQFQLAAEGMSLGAAVAHVFPDVTIGPMPSATQGGTSWGNALSAGATALRAVSGQFAYQANLSGVAAGYQRRQEEWDFQAALAKKEIDQIRYQIIAAEIRVEMLSKEVANHALQVRNNADTEAFLRTKFTNKELYSWMANQLSTVYYQSYQLAYQLGLAAQRAFSFELPLDADQQFLQYGSWDNLHQGLLAGEQLSFDLRRMDAAWLDLNVRQKELTKHVSMAVVDPRAIIALREKGTCKFSLNEMLFDLDHPGHYHRKIKGVSLTIPCVTGPHTNVSARLALNGYKIRVTPPAEDVPYSQQIGDDWITSFIGTDSIATSSAQNDSGVFQFNFQDERYLPFEGAGAISDWELTLSEFAQFDYGTISDIILTVHYTALDGDESLQATASEHVRLNIDSWLLESVNHGGPGLFRKFSLRQDFPNAFHQLLHPVDGNQETTLDIAQRHFPQLFQDTALNVDEIALMQVPKGGGEPILLNVGDFTIKRGDTAFTSADDASGSLAAYEDIQALVFVAAPEPVVGAWQLSSNQSLDPTQIEDIYLVFHYKQ